MKFIERFKLRLRANKYKNKYDKGGIAYINSSIRSGQTVLDIGAHKAGYLYFILNQVGKQGKVFAFEPQVNLYKYIVEMKSLFNWNNVTIEQLALSDSAGTATLFMPSKTASKGSSPGATIVKRNEQSHFKPVQTVPTDSLDAYCIRHQIKPDFLKIDVEGSELQIFQGGTQVLKERKPKLLVEIEARHVGQEQAVQTFEFLKSLGYQGYFLQGLDQVPLVEFRFDLHQDVGNMKNYCNNFIFE